MSGKVLTKAAIKCAAVLSAFFIAQSQGNCLALFSLGEFRDVGGLARIPASFGKLAGDYLCTDFCFMALANELHTVYRIPRDGGRATVFATGVDAILSDGLFLPESWGKLGGKYVTLGWVEPTKNKKGSTAGGGRMHAYSSNGKPELILQSPVKFSHGIVAPDWFGDFGGDILITTQTSAIKRITRDKSVKDFCDVPGALNLEFSPEDFGEHGKKLFVASGTDGRILTLTADGKSEVFTTIPLSTEQLSAHSIAFSPDGFLPYIKGRLMFVSVRSARTGGGIRGDVVAIDSTGKLVATMRPRLWSRAFEPSGVQFSPDGELLVCDSGTPAVHVVFPEDFVRSP